MRRNSIPFTLTFFTASILFIGIFISGCETLKEIELEEFTSEETPTPLATSTPPPPKTTITNSANTNPPIENINTTESVSEGKITPSLSWRPNAKFLVKDSIASLNPSYPDNVFLIIMSEGVAFPPEKIEISVYYENGELVDTLSFNKGIKMFTSNKFKSARIEEKINEGTEIIIKEGSGFDLNPGVILTVKMADSRYHSVFFESTLQVY